MQRIKNSHFFCFNHDFCSPFFFISPPLAAFFFFNESSLCNQQTIDLSNNLEEGRKVFCQCIEHFFKKKKKWDASVRTVPSRRIDTLGQSPPVPRARAFHGSGRGKLLPEPNLTSPSPILQDKMRLCLEEFPSLQMLSDLHQVNQVFNPHCSYLNYSFPLAGDRGALLERDLPSRGR